MNSKIIVVGSTNTDMACKLPVLPTPGETVVGGEFFRANGGKGANQAVAAARSGGQVGMLGCVGVDEFGHVAISNMAKDGVDTTIMKLTKDAQTGIALIFVDQRGQNSIAVAPGANSLLLPADIEKAEKRIAHAEIVLLQYEIHRETVEKTIDLAHKHGAKVLFNPAPAKEISPDTLPKIDYLVLNTKETELFTGIKTTSDEQIKKAAASLREKGVKNVIITLGSAGSYIAGEEMDDFVQPMPVKAADTTAAGDVFCGALATALSENKRLPEAMQFATAAASISVTRMGAQSSIPGRKEIDELLAAQTKE
jgi:ribokinase